MHGTEIKLAMPTTAEVAIRIGEAYLAAAKEVEFSFTVRFKDPGGYARLLRAKRPVFVWGPTAGVDPVEDPSRTIIVEPLEAPAPAPEREVEPPAKPPVREPEKVPARARS